MSKLRMLRGQAYRLAPILLMAAAGSFAATPPNYFVHLLVADQPGVADFTDPNLVNPWGICESGTSPFWLSDGGTGLSTVYTSNGTPNASLKPAVVPTAKGSSPSVPTGCVANATGGFQVQGKGANFIFVTADGGLSAWSSAIDATKTQLMVDNSSTGAKYFGLAISATTAASTPLLFAANLGNGTIDVFDTNYKPVPMPGAFVDASVPAGYGPWNIQNIGGKLYVTYAKQNAGKTFAVTGAGLGAVAVFDLSGNLLKHIATGGVLNAPWGVAIAPATFGAFANDLLVGNFGDGTINAFDPTTGTSLGTMLDQNGDTISFSGLWGLQVGNGGSGGDANAVYFAAGTGGQRHGVLGSLQAAPTITSVTNAAGVAGNATIAQNAYMSIFGASLAAQTRSWAFTDFVGTALPKSLDGVSVTINGKAAYVYYISPKQIDVLTPADTATGPVQVVVTNNGLVSNSMPITMQQYSPAFFLFKDNKSIAALHGSGGIIGATTLYANLSTPAKAGETITLYGNGFGTTSPAFGDGQIVSVAAPCATTPTATFGGAPANVTYCGLVGSGVYVVNVTIPANAATGDNAVVLSFGSTASTGTTTINVQ